MIRIVLALNVEHRQALLLRDLLGNRVDVYKIGIDMFARLGPAVVREFTSAGCGVFLDLKFADIPSVVARAVESAAALDVSMLTVHTMAGATALTAAVKAAAAVPSRPLILAVTVLTSLDRQALASIAGCDQPVVERVTALARMAQDCGCDGVVASPQEIAPIRATCGPRLLIVTPGIRLSPAIDDQARVLTPAQAAAAGADYIVVGRPVTDAPDPLAVVNAIRQQLGRD